MLRKWVWSKKKSAIDTKCQVSGYGNSTFPGLKPALLCRPDILQCIRSPNVWLGFTLSGMELLLYFLCVVCLQHIIDRDYYRLFQCHATIPLITNCIVLKLPIYSRVTFYRFSRAPLSFFFFLTWLSLVWQLQPVQSFWSCVLQHNAMSL